MNALRFKSCTAILGCAVFVCLVTSVPLFAADSAADDSLKDDRIQTALESELWGAKGVNANAIDSTVNAGVVTLSGNVNNILTKESAVRIAKMNKGVRSVIDQLKVSGVDRPNQELQQDVLSALAQDPATDSWEMTVEANNGTVTLAGAVDSYAERELAAKVAKATRGVKALTNNITVTYSSDRTDHQISEDIEQRLNWDVRLDDELVTVEVKDGKVTLSGTVGSDYEKTLARGDAWVAGVKSVDDENLTVAWWSRDDMQRKTDWASLGDDKIRDAIDTAFLYDPRVYSFKPSISVENGIVTLTGVVDNLKAKRAAAQDAKNTVGVWRVKNYLKVRPVATRTSDEIKQDVVAAFTRDPFVERFEITTSVYNGEVYLYGDIDSYYEKEHAEDLAITVNGVTGVHNYLDVSYDYPSYLDYDYYDWDPTLYDYDYDYETTRTKPDKDINDDIVSQLWWSPWVDENEVTVTVDNGTATLTRTVDTWTERSKASENAIEGGAVKVINKLDVEY